MSFKSKVHRVARQCGVCTTLLIAVAILIPGCAGKRSELLSSIIPQKAKEGEDSSAAEDVDPVVAAAELIAEAEKSKANSRLSAFTEEEIVEGPPRLFKRIRNRFRRHEESIATTDPFLDVDVARTDAEKAEGKPPADKPQASVAKSDGPTVDEILASFESRRAASPSAEVEPWWMTDTNKSQATSSDTSWSTQAAKPATRRATLAQADADFAEEFDSRLDRLRAELAGAETADQNVARHDNQVEENPFAFAETKPASVSSDLLTKPAEQLQNATSESDSLTQTASLSQTTDGTVRQRIKAMLADAQRDRENWNLRRAYRTALDAQELAVLEHVQFAADDERPQQLADEIADDLRRDVIRPASSGRDVAENEVAKADVTPFGDESDPLEKAVTSRFGFPEFSETANPWTSVSSRGAEVPQAADAMEIVAEPGKRTSGVSLLPPADDFPSDAARSEWGLSDSSFAPVPSASDTEDIELTTHNSPEFTLTRNARSRDPLPGLSDKDNQALLTSVAKQSSRVLEPKSVEFPSLAAPTEQADEPIARREPIRIAKAPRFALEDEAALAPIPPKSTSTKAPASGSLLGQFWRSQPVWFIGGLLLLIVALRLLPWPRRGTE